MTNKEVYRIIETPGSDHYYRFDKYIIEYIPTKTMVYQTGDLKDAEQEMDRLYRLQYNNEFCKWLK